MENFEVKEQGNNANTLLSAVKLAYRQYKSDLDYVKNKSNIWEGKPYRQSKFNSHTKTLFIY
jgi:hypothetical protein